jgi:hypothetical protein
MSMTKPDYRRLAAVVMEAEETHRVKQTTVPVPDVLGDDLSMEVIPSADGTLAIEFLDGVEVVARTEASVPTEMDTLRANIMQTYERAKLSMLADSARDTISALRERAASLRS